MAAPLGPKQLSRLRTQLQSWAQGSVDVGQQQTYEPLRRDLEVFNLLRDQVPVDERRALVAALAAVCSTEMCSASCTGGATPQQTAGNATAPRPSLAPGSAAAVAHSELLRLCVLSMGRAGSMCGVSNTTGTPSSHSRACIGSAGTPSAHGRDAQVAKIAAQEALSALLTVLEACIGGSARPLTDPVASGFYAALLKALRLLVPEAVQEQHIAPLVTCLRKFLRYGVQPADGLSGKSGCVPLGGGTIHKPAAKPLPGPQPSGGAYRPPQHRPSSLNGCIDSDSASDSDSDGGSGAADRLGGGRVRRGALLALSAASAAQPRALQSHWAALLPRAPAVARRAGMAPTLADALLFDPQPQVRAAAAVAIGALLEAPVSRAYLGIAEVRPAARQPARYRCALPEFVRGATLLCLPSQPVLPAVTWAVSRSIRGMAACQAATCTVSEDSQYHKPITRTL